MMRISISDSDKEFIKNAADFFENPSFLLKMANMFGLPLQKLTEALPESASGIVDAALKEALRIAVDTVGGRAADSTLEEAYRASGWTGLWHRVAATVTGGAGGAFGLAGLAIELPVTTGIIFRSIASTAQEFGENITTPEGRLECLTVLAYGGPGKSDDAMDASYLSARLAMATLVRDAAVFVAKPGAQAITDAIAAGTAPSLIRLIAAVSSRFGIIVTEKFLAQSLPVIGIVTGATINNAFAGHFNDAARYHFGIRKLERTHGTDVIQAEYRALAKTVTLPGPGELGLDAGSP
jgi:hypothetical protein